MAREMKDSGIEWIGEIPSKWSISKNKYLLEEMYSGGTPTASNEEFYAENGTPFVSISDMSSTDYIRYTKKKLTEKGVKDKNLIILPVGTVLYSIYATIGAVSELMLPATISQAILALRIKPSYDKQYYKYNLNAMRDYVFFNANGNTQFNLNSEKVWNYYFVQPPLIEQKRIVHYLDDECKRIDTVVEQTRSSIEEYKRLKQSTITQTVTKGIRPNREMKDSGIEWVGEIPAEWNVQRIKTIFSLRDERNYLPLEEVNLISLYTDKGVVQHSDLEKTTGNKASNADGYKIVCENDIIVNIILCWMGAIGRSSYQGVTSPAYDIYVPSNTIECRFYHHYFRTKGFSGDCYKRGKGIMAMRWRTYSDQFRDIKVVVPPLKEQQEILNYLDEKTAAIDSLIQKKEQLITELEAYKKSLIYEYVTGKKEAPAHAH